MGATTYRSVPEHNVAPDGQQPWPYQVPTSVFTHRELPKVANDIRFAQGSVTVVHDEMLAAADGRNV